MSFKLQLHDAIYRLRFYSNSLIHILSLSNSHNNVASMQKNRGDKSHRVIVALSLKQMTSPSNYQWRGGSEAAGEAARLMATPPPPVILLLPFGLGRVSCRRHNMQ